MLYTPRHFQEQDPQTLYDFINANNFGILLTTHAGQIDATHLPFVLDQERQTLLAHMARANKHWQRIAQQSEALVIFNGAHAYVSPTWYTEHPSVPTWNYSTVHVRGSIQILEGDDAAHHALQMLSHYHEPPTQSTWQMESLPEDYMARQVKSIAVMEIAIQQMEGKFKLSQNRSETDQAQVIAHLHQGNEADQATAHLMQQRRLKK